jgi:predicted AAA+ superfamily ATPase
MKRTILDNLKAWQNASGRKPLVLKGARQVGKTWALQEFGQCRYEREGAKCHYVDMKESRDLHSIFEESFDPRKIVSLLEFRLRRNINLDKDLLILDEIQECPSAITSLKYFEQDLNELDLIVAGSHLGLMKNEESFPVGKVNLLQMYPMNFEEFVAVLDAKAHGFLSPYQCDEVLPAVVHERLLELLTLYFFTGGLPEAVMTLLAHWPDRIAVSVPAVRKVQNDLIQGYRADFAKYSGVVNATHINYVFDALPEQLSRTQDESVKRFRFRQVIPNRKGFDSIAGPLSWLLESRLCIRNRIAKRAEHPLRSYCDANRFKVFLFDIGLLNCMLRLPGEVILGEDIGPYKGFILENFVAQELFSVTNEELISWQQGTAELEFLVTQGGRIVPVEVKSAARARRAKSLDAYISRYKPRAAYKLSRQNFSFNPGRGITTLPVYCSYKLPAVR